MPLKPRQKTDSVWPDFFDYFRQDFRRELSGWSYVIRYYGMLTPLLILGLVALFLYVDPIPPLVGRPNGEPLCCKLRTLVENQHRAPNLTLREYAIDEEYGGAIRDREQSPPAHGPKLERI
ncbi:MAG: hypothetical protein IT507_00535 [Burkholderiaceae bacterium]|nr:hypothetical protein [Burkholderiaceae bacterium]